MRHYCRKFLIGKVFQAIERYTMRNYAQGVGFDHILVRNMHAFIPGLNAEFKTLN